MKPLFYLLVLCTHAKVLAQSTLDSLPIQTYTYDTAHDLKIYGVKPANFDTSGSYAAVLVFHGGGWSIGEASWGFSTAQHYAKKGMVAFSVQYRLENAEKGFTPYEAVLDAQKAMRWVREHADEFAIDLDKIAAYGWSAGAHLAACAAVFENLGVPEAEHSSAPNLLLLKSPAVSLMGYSDFPRRLGDKISVAGLSPAEQIHDKTPPTLIVIGRTDTVTPLAQSERYQKNMEALGRECELIVYNGVGHLFTPATEPDNDWPNPDPKIRQAAQDAMDAFLIKHGYLR